MLRDYLVLCNCSSIPTQYVSNNTEQHDGSGDVVIVVNALDDGDPIETDVVVGGLPDVCIETEGDVEPNSPKTITESSTSYDDYSSSTSL
uniref:Uncharacterized protein n=1 Tax=Phlebotomus papatasi TaxID=29031 RepID=A0A1B0D8R0_PHLPP